MAHFAHFRPAELSALAAIVGVAPFRRLDDGDPARRRELRRLRRRSRPGRDPAPDSLRAVHPGAARTWTSIRRGELHRCGRHARPTRSRAPTPRSSPCRSPPCARSASATRRSRSALYWAFWKSLSLKLRRTNDQLGRFFPHAADGRRREPARREARDRRVPHRHPREARAVRRAAPVAARDQLPHLALEGAQAEVRAGPLPRGRSRRRHVRRARRADPDQQVHLRRRRRGARLPRARRLLRRDGAHRPARRARRRRGPTTAARWCSRSRREVVNGLLDVHKVSSLPLLKILCALVTKRLRELDDKIVGWYILSGGDAASSI